MREIINLIGQKFYQLSVIEFVGTENGSAIWKCKCDCGNEITARGARLRNGHVKSCGCRKGKVTAQRNFRHGHTGTRLYRIWSLMNDRCRNPRSPSYERYGKRGICVCEDWKSFEPFYNWAMDNGYSENLTIDRKDNDGNYEPGNCRWATNLEQNNNTRKNTFVFHDEQSHTLAEWSRLLGIPYHTIHNRVKRGLALPEILRSY